MRRPPSSVPGALRRRSQLPNWATLLLRIALAFALIGVALAVHWLDRAGLRDNSNPGRAIGFTDIIYFTMITVTTVGFGDIVPVTERARLFDTFLVTPIRLFVWLIFLGTAYDFMFKRVWEKWRMRVIQARLEGHVVIAGYGITGEEAVRELMARGTDPAQIVVIDERDAALAAAEACGAAVLSGDATRNATLEAVRIDRAQSLIVSAGRDDTSILIVLTARGMAADIPISVIIKSDDNEALAKQAGATTVINPASFAGLLLAGSCRGPHIAEYMADLAAADGRVALRERAVTAAEAGTPLSALKTGIGVRVYRAGVAHGFWDDAAQALQEGDVVIEIAHGDDRERN